jgi:iron complex outermembrane receptor protein
MFKFFIKIPVIILTIFIVISSYANDQEDTMIIDKLKQLSLMELINVEVFNPSGSLAARKVQKLSETPAALFVLTQEDIHRAGITNIAEALRMVPGLQVARIHSSQWAISARGLNDQYASKLLVMIDGRTVYSPLRSQVNWDVQGTLIEDIERIEVIRGSGASLWGANAVNGIVNIITKSAKDTQGTLISSTFGRGEEQNILGIRHGGKLGEHGHYRVYSKFYEHDSFVNAQSEDQNDNWRMKRAGFDMDWKSSEDDSWSLQGEIYDGSIKVNTSTFTVPANEINATNTVSGLHLLSRWQHQISSGEIILQSYYNRLKRNEVYWQSTHNIYDIDFQHRSELSDRYEFLWGLGFRYTDSSIAGSNYLTYIPNNRTDNLFSAFAQSEFSITEDLRLIIGSKFEHNDYTGFEVQPNIRMLWNINEIHSMWAAVSRAVRTPARIDEDLQINIFIPQSVKLQISGNPNLNSEELIAYELGYRFNPTNNFLFDLSLFYNNYDELRSIETSFQPFPIPTIFNQYENQMFGHTYGLELASHWQVTDDWKLIGTYSYLYTDLEVTDKSNYTGFAVLEHNSPRNQFSLRSLWNINDNLQLDAALYYVDALESQNIPEYNRFDLRLGWQANKNLTISLGGRNLFDKQHSEFGGFSSTGSSIYTNEIPRSFYLQLQYQY